MNYTMVKIGFKKNFEVKKTEYGNFLLIKSPDDFYGTKQFPIFESRPIDYDIKKNQDRLLNSLFKFE